MHSRVAKALHGFCITTELQAGDRCLFGNSVGSQNALPLLANLLHLLPVPLLPAGNRRRENWMLTRYPITFFNEFGFIPVWVMGDAADKEQGRKKAQSK